MAEPTETDRDPKLAIKVITADYAGAIYEATRDVLTRLQLAVAPTLTPAPLTPWADLDERQRGTFIRDTQDAFVDITTAATNTGIRP